MPFSSKLLNPVRQVLSDRSFTPSQIERVIPRLHDELKRQPNMLAEIIDVWNSVMGSSRVPQDEPLDNDVRQIPATASPAPNSLVAKQRINMNTILAEVAPDLLLLDPEKLWHRHDNIKGLGIINNSNEHWIMLFNAPRGLYLQNWMDLTRKVYYIEHKVLDLLYDKKEMREMTTHPLVKSAAVIEADFDHIRTRYLFAHRAGFKELSHMQRVQTMLTRPKIKDLVLLDDANYLMKFAPYCTDEDYSCFSNLIKNHELEDEDAEVCKQLAELDSVRHPMTLNKRFREWQESIYSQ